MNPCESCRKIIATRPDQSGWVWHVCEACGHAQLKRPRSATRIPCPLCPPKKKDQ